MTTYTGMILVGQSDGYLPDASGSSSGFGYWYPISSDITTLSTTDPSYNIINSNLFLFCDNMTVNYNGGGLYPEYGLEFTNVDLTEYNLNVRFGGLLDPSATTFGFTSVNPNPNP